MLILALNPGSTSTKFSLYDGDKEVVNENVTGSVENIEAKLQEKGYSIKNVDHFGIRVVHGGMKFYQTTLITPDVLEELKKTAKFAPLHNPPAIKLIEQLFSSNGKIWAIFDTAFHHSIPEYHSRYAIPKDISDKLEIKRFGFHGIACQSVISQLREKGPLPSKLVIAHLGGGSSVTAVKDGESIDTSMGFTPIEGLMMVTRCGNLDVGVASYIQEEMKMTEDELLNMLNKESGILGITGKTDVADVFEGKTENDRLAREMFMSRVLKKIFASVAVLDGIDAIALSGGIGENSKWVQDRILTGLKLFNISELNIIKVDEAEEIRRQIAERIKN